MQSSWRLRRYLRRYVLLRPKVEPGWATGSPEDALFAAGVVPTMIVLRPDGEEVGRSSGYSSPKELAYDLATISDLRELIEEEIRRVREAAPGKVRFDVVGDLLSECLKVGWVADAARVVEYSQCRGNRALAGRVWEVDTRLLTTTYELAAWSGRASGWSRLELPERFRALADPRLRELVEACRRSDGPRGAALREALREALRAAAARLVRERLRAGVWDGGWPKIVRFARDHGCAAELTAPLAAFLAGREAGSLDDETLGAALAAVAAAGGPPELARRLVEVWVEHPGGFGLVGPQVLYLAGERDRALSDLVRVQRQALERGFTLWAHRLGRVRRQMRAGTWRPAPAWIESWPPR